MLEIDFLFLVYFSSTNIGTPPQDLVSPKCDSVSFVYSFVFEIRSDSGRFCVFQFLVCAPGFCYSYLSFFFFLYFSHVGPGMDLVRPLNTSYRQSVTGPRVFWPLYSRLGTIRYDFAFLGSLYELFVSSYELFGFLV